MELMCPFTKEACYGEKCMLYVTFHPRESHAKVQACGLVLNKNQSGNYEYHMAPPKK